MTLPIETVRILLERELDAFTREIEAYPDDASTFATPPGVRTPPARSRYTSQEISSTSSAIASAERATRATAMPSSRSGV